MHSKIAYLKEKDFRLARVIDEIGVIKIQSINDPFSFLLSEVVGQLLSAQVREVIFNRLILLCDGHVTPDKILSLDTASLTNCGMSLRKANCIQDIARAIKNGTLVFNDLSDMSDEDVAQTLMRIKGIGVWTAKMYLLFFLQREDILPYEDGAFMQSFRWLYGFKNPSKETVIKRCKKWKPYSSLAARYLYRALDNGLTKQPIGTFLCNL